MGCGYGDRLGWPRIGTGGGRIKLVNIKINILRSRSAKYKNSCIPFSMFVFMHSSFILVCNTLFRSLLFV